MTPERIAEIRLMPHDNWRIIHELLDAIEAAQQEIADLKRGGAVVPDIPADRVLGEALADLENAVRFLAKQESSLFEIRGKAIRLLAQGEIEAAKDLITMKWPIIQGLRNQLDIAEVGKQACDIKRVRPAIDHMLRAQPTQEPAP